MLRKVSIVILHILFWVLGIYIVSKVFGVSTVEVFAESNSSEEQQVVITYDDNFVWATIVTVSLSVLVFYTNVFILLPSYFKSRKFLHL